MFDGISLEVTTESQDKVQRSAPKLGIKEEKELISSGSIKKYRGNKIVLDLEFCKVDDGQAEMQKTKLF